MISYDYEIRLVPDDERESSILVCLMPEGTDKQDAVIDLFGYADLIDEHAGVGRWAWDVADHVPGGVIRRFRESCRVRLDCWEHETEKWIRQRLRLQVREVPR